MSLKFFDFYSYRNYGFLFSIIFTIVTIIGYCFSGLNLGIDFKGGIIIEITSEIPGKIKDSLSAKYSDIVLQQLDKNLVIRLQNTENSSVKITDQIKSEILQVDKEVNFLKIDFVGPKISNDLVKKAGLAFFWSLFVVMIYILIRFNWKFSVGAILSLIHDLTASIGFFVFTGYEFNLTSIAAILTIIGYSVNDSVVIYDRIRENSSSNKQNYLTPKVINKSINETLSRTLMTFLTTFVACLALWVFGGENLRSFSAVITFGVAFGTYSSIFISANVLPFLAKR
ncbi:MAG: protein translocase subunit SecF [Candidatus Midichloriaceae bacterium]